MTRILVIGATGMLGRPVARRLNEDGVRVRVLSRNADRARALFGDEFEVVAGDVERPATIAKALESCDGVHVSLKAGPAPASYDRVEREGTETVARLAREAGVKRLTYLSGASTSKENSWYYATKAKYEAENAIRESGIEHTIFRASWFMETLHLFVRGSRVLKFGKQPAVVHWIAAADYADMVSRSYGLADARNRTLYVYGPEKLCLLDAMKLYCSRARPGLRVSTLPIWMARLLAALARNEELRDVASLMAYYENITETADPLETHRLFGVPPTTLAKWCEIQRQGASQAQPSAPAAPPVGEA